VTLDIRTSDDSAYRFTRFGNATFELEGKSRVLELYWVIESRPAALLSMSLVQGIP
jgi:hypothetical protein